MKVQYSLIRVIMFYEFELDDNVAKATKKLFCKNGESVVNHGAVSK